MPDKTDKPDKPEKTESKRERRDLTEVLTGANGMLVVLASLAGLAATSFGKIQDFLQHTTGLSIQTARLLAFTGIGAGLLLLIAYFGLRKRSRLLEPDALIIETDNPEHLHGRAEELRLLKDTCRKHGFVFLVGESGAGKTALLTAGLVKDPPQGYYPVYVDSWGDDWERGPLRALRTALNHSLSEEQKKTLGVRAGLDDHAVKKVLETSGTVLGLLPLIVLDQFDDYQTQHRTRFLRDHVWVKTADIVRENAFWRQMKDLLEREQAHLLVATRADAAAALDTIRLTGDPERFNLDRLHKSVVEPLLGMLSTGKTGERQVVSNPENGWTQLRARLAIELATDNTVLPAQMRMAFLSLRALQPLSVGRFDRIGGLEGLEAAYVRDRIAEAARANHLTEEQLRVALLELLDNERKKTAIRSLKTLTEAAARCNPAQPVTEAQIAGALNDLETKGLVRKRIDPESGEPGYSLIHDYLARGVVGAHNRANRETVALRDGEHRMTLAQGNVPGIWRSLLPLSVSVRLAVNRVRGRFKYGPHRRYAIYSALRAVPLVLTLAAVGYTWYVVRRADLNQRASDAIFEAIASGNDDGLWSLATAAEAVKEGVLERFLESEFNAERFFNHTPEPIVAAIWGIDSRLAVRIFDRVAMPKLRLNESQSARVTAISHLLQRLPPDAIDRTRVDALLLAIERMKGADEWSAAVVAVAKATDMAVKSGGGGPERVLASTLEMLETGGGGTRQVSSDTLASTLFTICQPTANQPKGCAWETLATAFRTAASDEQRRLISNGLLAVQAHATKDQLMALGESFPESISSMASGRLSDAPNGELTALSTRLPAIRLVPSRNAPTLFAGRLLGVTLFNEKDVPCEKLASETADDLVRKLKRGCVLEDGQWARVAVLAGALEDDENVNLAWTRASTARREWIQAVLLLVLAAHEDKASLPTAPAPVPATAASTPSTDAAVADGAEPGAAVLRQVEACLERARRLPAADVRPAFLGFLEAAKRVATSDSIDLSSALRLVAHLVGRLDPMRALDDVLAQIASTRDRDAAEFFGKVLVLAVERAPTGTGDVVGTIVKATRNLTDDTQVDAHGVGLIAAIRRSTAGADDLMRRFKKLSAEDGDRNRRSKWQDAMVEVVPKLTRPADEWASMLTDDWLRTPWASFAAPIRAMLPALNDKARADLFQRLGGLIKDRELSELGGELGPLLAELAAGLPRSLVTDTLGRVVQNAEVDHFLDDLIPVVIKLQGEVPATIAFDLFDRWSRRRGDTFGHLPSQQLTTEAHEALVLLAGRLTEPDRIQAVVSALHPASVNHMWPVLRVLAKLLTPAQRDIAVEQILLQVGDISENGPLLQYLEVLDSLQALTPALMVELAKWPRVLASEDSHAYLLKRLASHVGAKEFATVWDAVAWLDAHPIDGVDVTDLPRRPAPPADRAQPVSGGSRASSAQSR